MFCLRPEFVSKLKQAFKNGDLTPEKLDVDSAKRRDLLTKYVDKDTAKEIGLLFEKKLLLKNQEKAMYDFGKEVFGTNKAAKEAFIEKVRQAHADKNRRLFDPKENEAFLNEITSDIYSKKYGTDVSLEEAQAITELATDAKEAKDSIKDTSVKTKESADFGAKKVALDNYVANLKLESQKESLINPLTEKGVGGKVGAVLHNARISFKFIADNSRAIVASMDNSLWFRQGMKALVNPLHTKAWVNNFIESWKDIGKTVIRGIKEGDVILDAVKAEIYSRPNYLNGRYELGKKLDIGTGEEAYPTSLPSKIPILGRLFRGTEVAYEAGAMRLRADIADKLYSLAEKTGVDMESKKEVGDINEVVNSMTGRGRLGAGEKAGKVLNSVFFSAKFLKSNVDLLISPVKLALEPTSFAKQQAALNLLSVVATVGVVSAIAKSLDPDSVDFSLNSSKFGKIQFGHGLTVDLTAGAGGLVILASKIISQSSKNSKTGITKKLGEGYGSQTGMDVLWSFTEGKFSPMFGALRDFAKQKDFQGNKPTIPSEALKMVEPISISNISQFNKESIVDQLIGVILDGVGLGVNSSSNEKDWGQDTTKEIKAFKENVGDKKFKEANDLYNQKYSDWLDKTIVNKDYINLKDEEKQRIITKEKSDIKKEVFKEYGFHYKREHTSRLPKF